MDRISLRENYNHHDSIEITGLFQLEHEKLQLETKIYLAKADVISLLLFDCCFVSMLFVLQEIIPIIKVAHSRKNTCSHVLVPMIKYLTINAKTKSYKREHSSYVIGNIKE